MGILWAAPCGVCRTFESWFPGVLVARPARCGWAPLLVAVARDIDHIAVRSAHEEPSQARRLFDERVNDLVPPPLRFLVRLIDTVADVSRDELLTRGGVTAIDDVLGDAAAQNVGPASRSRCVRCAFAGRGSAGSAQRRRRATARSCRSRGGPRRSIGSTGAYRSNCSTAARTSTITPWNGVEVRPLLLGAEHVGPDDVDTVIRCSRDHGQPHALGAASGRSERVALVVACQSVRRFGVVGGISADAMVGGSGGPLVVRSDTQHTATC